jgi:excinuclease ABC subunit A
MKESTTKRDNTKTGSPQRPTKWIEIQGARQHNLKNVTVRIPKECITVVTGPSGSGKSSLAFDTLFAEGQRRYMESLSTYARQFWE